MNEYNNGNDNQQNNRRNMLNKAAQKAALKLGKAMAKGLMIIIKSLLPILLPIIGILALVLLAYFISFEFTGTEKEYSKDYSNNTTLQEREIYTSDSNNPRVVYVRKTEDEEMSAENKTIQDFYMYFSGQSLRQLVGQSDKPIKPDDEDSVEDYYKREDEFKLTPNLIFSIDEYIYNSKWKYPEQTIKPVNFNPDTLELEQLTDDFGIVTALSEEEDINTGIKTGKKIKSVRDYGLSSVLAYNIKEDYKRTLMVKGVYDAIDVWDSQAGEVVTVPHNEEFELIMDDYPQDIYIIDKAITFVGEVEYLYEYKKEYFDDLVPGATSKENEPKSQYLYAIHLEPIYQAVPVEGGGFVMVVVGYDRYELYKHRSADSGIFEELPTVIDTIVTDKGDKYFKDYVYNFESYIPIDTINSFDFSSRINYDSYVFDSEQAISSDHGFNLGTKTSNVYFKGATQYLPIIEKYANQYDIDPYVVLAIMAHDAEKSKDKGRIGIMHVSGSESRTVTAKDRYGNIESFTITKAGREKPEDTIKYGVMYLAYLKEQMDGDIYKAIQSYSFGLSVMNEIKNTNIDAWNSSFGWLLYREEGRLKQHPNSASESYGCIAYKEGKTVSGNYFGDSCFLENVLEYYSGNKIESKNEDNNSFWSKLKKLGKSFMEFVKIREENELVPKINYIGHGRYDKVADILVTTKSLDEGLFFSEIDLDEYSGDMNFWDSGYFGSISSMGITMDRILDMAPNSEGYSPPIDMANTSAIVTSPFGYRIHPILKTRKFHTGVDVASQKGTPVYSIADGVISKASYNGSAGNMVRIEHNEGVSSVYMHLDRFTVKVGDSVRRGQVVGTVGNTGRSTGPHLHFEFRVNNSPIDPTAIILGN